jgi:hypothetical protein
MSCLQLAWHLLVAAGVAYIDGIFSRCFTTDILFQGADRGDRRRMPALRQAVAIQSRDGRAQRQMPALSEDI